MRDVSIVRKTVAENDNLSKRRRLRVNENWSRQKNGDAQKFCYSHDFPLLKNGIHVPFGCNLCIPQIIRNIDVQVCAPSRLAAC
jgi:hypothetical protein